MATVSDQMTGTDVDRAVILSQQSDTHDSHIRYGNHLGTHVQGPAVAMIHTKVRLFYPLAHVQ